MEFQVSPAVKFYIADVFLNGIGLLCLVSYRMGYNSQLQQIVNNIVNIIGHYVMAFPSKDIITIGEIYCDF